jgi:hypothetical protein
MALYPCAEVEIWSLVLDSYRFIRKQGYFNTSTTSSNFEQLDDVLDGVVGFNEGRFEFAVWPWCCSG